MEYCSLGRREDRGLFDQGCCLELAVVINCQQSPSHPLFAALHIRARILWNYLRFDFFFICHIHNYFWILITWRWVIFSQRTVSKLFFPALDSGITNLIANRMSRKYVTGNPLSWLVINPDLAYVFM